MGPWQEAVARDSIFVIHNIVIMILLGCGFFSVSFTTFNFIKHFQKLNSLVKSFGSVILPDILLIVLFFPQAAYFLYLGEVRQSNWCKLLAWAILADLTALLGGSVIIAFATYRLVAGRPLSDRHLITWNLVNWVAAVVVAAGFWIDGILGPYKNLYCCVREDAYHTWAVASTLFFIFAAGLLSSYYYAHAYKKLMYLEKVMTTPQNVAHTKASRIVIKRGTLLVILIYFFWSLIIVAGFIIGAGGTVPASLDMFGAFLVKCMPLFDSLFLQNMIKKVIRKDSQVNPERDSMIAKARDSNSLQHLHSPSSKKTVTETKGKFSRRSVEASRGSTVPVPEQEAGGGKPDIETGRSYQGKITPPSPTAVAPLPVVLGDEASMGGMTPP